jgi:hypothetical protein
MTTSKQLQEKLDRLQFLIKELELSKRAEECSHHLVLDEVGINSQHYYISEKVEMRFFLIEISSGKVVSAGNKRTILTYIRHRIKFDHILDLELLNLSVDEYHEKYVELPEMLKKAYIWLKSKPIQYADLGSFKEI